MKSELENYYRGDNAWERYVGYFKESWKRCPFKDELIALVNGDIELAIVIYGIHDEDSIFWINSIIPALNGLSPVECLKSEVLIKRLKTLLMRLNK